MKRLMVFSDYLPIQQTRMFSSRFSSNFIRLFSILALVMTSGVSRLHSQGNCGILPTNQATTTHPDSIVYDRFGNTYDAFPAWTFALTIPCNFSGYYHLDCTEALPPGMDDALCQIFAEMSAIFPRRINFNECGEQIPHEPVNIIITPYHGGQSGVAAALQLSYAPTKGNCNTGGPMESGRVYHRINGGTQKRFNFVHDGLLFINIDVNWNLDFVNLPGPTQRDFRTAMKHEILHLMGIESLINMDGMPANGYYSIYDKYLAVVPYYNNGGNTQNLISSNCLMNCFDFNAHLFSGATGFVNAVVDNCNSIPGGFDFIFNNPTVPISGGRGIVPANNMVFGNMLSHFHESCNGIISNFIMQPNLPPETRRAISPEELSVMCTLGYQVAGGCDGCYLVNYYEHDLENDFNIYSCCDNLYFTCPDREIVISFDDLLCNNANNGISEITDM